MGPTDLFGNLVWHRIAPSVGGVVPAPEVSVITPIRNAEATVARQLESVLDQRLTVPWEIIVVDNGSTDDSQAITRATLEGKEWPPELCGAFLWSLPRPRGHASPRNFGAFRARGRLLGFLDADDVAGENWLANLVAALTERALVCSEQVPIGGRREPRSIPPVKFGLQVVPTSGMGCRKDLFVELGGFDLHFDPGGADVDFSVRAFRDLKVSPALAPGAAVCRLDRPGSETELLTGLPLWTEPGPSLAAPPRCSVEIRDRHRRQKNPQDRPQGAAPPFAEKEERFPAPGRLAPRTVGLDSSAGSPAQPTVARWSLARPSNPREEDPSMTPATPRGGTGRPLIMLLLAGFLLLGFSWGYFVHRNKIFPYGTARGLAGRIGLLHRAAGAPSKHAVPATPTHATSALSGLSYVNGVVDPHADRSGVVTYRRDWAFAGLNLFSPRLLPRAYLVDMQGKVVHRWTTKSGPWQHVTLLPGGDLLALVKDQELIRLDSRSRVLWRRIGAFHHDLSVAPDGRIYALTRTAEQRPDINPELPTLVDEVTLLSPEGEVLDDLSLLDIILDSPYAFLLPSANEIHPPSSPGGERAGRIESGPLDILHSNHVEVLDGHLANVSPLFASGNLLLSSRTLSTIYILDPRSRRILWAWGPSNLVFQHDPTLLENGHILIFDNGSDRSQVVELDPLQRKVVWRYGADDFFSATRGSVQRLPNGNTLVTESDTGYVFEVTPAGERVWVFANPFFTEGTKRMPIWRMRRFERGDPRLPFDSSPAR